MLKLIDAGVYGLNYNDEKCGKVTKNHIADDTQCHNVVLAISPT